MQNAKEITTPLRSPLTGWRKPKPFPEAKPKPAKEKYDDPLVHELLQYFRDALGTELDGAFLMNYAACKELVSRCIAKGNDPKQILTTLVDISIADPFHSKNATSWRYLLNHGIAIFKARQQRATNPKTQTPDDRQRELAEATKRLFDRRRAEAGTPS